MNGSLLPTREPDYPQPPKKVPTGPVIIEKSQDALKILENVYKKSLPNRYLASFAIFLAENRGHYMIENIIEDGLWDFFSVHLAHYSESGEIPVFFTGSVAFGFQDILKELCKNFGWQAGKFLAKPMEGLIKYHKTR